MTTVTGVSRPAAGDQELEEVFRLRAEVFFGEDILRFGHADRLTDELDRHPATVNLVVAAGRLSGDVRLEQSPNAWGASSTIDVVGAVRVTFPAPEVETTRSAYFDFAPFVRGDEARTASGSMLCVRPDYRRSKLGTTLTRSIMQISRRQSMRYLCVAARPISVPFLLRLGWQAVAPEFDHPVELVPVIPMIVDLTTVTEPDHDRLLGERFALT